MPECSGAPRAKRSGARCPRVLGIDEHFFSRRQGYATTFCDLGNHSVYDVVLGRSEKALEDYLSKLPGREAVRVVCMDLSSTYRAIVRKHFPQAQIVADRFHVIRLINHHFLALWREVDPAACKNRGLLSLMRRHRHNLKPDQQQRLSQYLAEHPALHLVYRLKQYLCYLLLKKHRTRKQCRKLIPRLLKVSDQLRGAGPAQLVTDLEQAGDEFAALLACAVFLQQQIAEILLEAVDEMESWMLSQVLAEPLLLIRFEIVAVAAHEREQAAVFAGRRVHFPPKGQEVVVDEANDVEAVGHNLGLGEVLPDDGPVGGRQIHADHPDRLPPGQLAQIVLQCLLGASQHHVVNAVVAEIAEGGGVALAAGEEVLVNAQYARTSGATALGARGPTALRQNRGGRGSLRLSTLRSTLALRGSYQTGRVSLMWHAEFTCTTHQAGFRTSWIAMPGRQAESHPNVLIALPLDVAPSDSVTL